MIEEKIKWEFPDNYRNGRATIGDYLLMISGGDKHQFHWVVFYNNNEIASSTKYCPCRSIPEAQRITAAIYDLSKNIL